MRESKSLQPDERITIKTARRRKIAFLFDVDNTLLNNDAILRDLRKFLEEKVGSRHASRYWKIFEQLREELQYADYLGALQRYRGKFPHDVRVLKVSHFLIDYNFRKRLFPKALAVLAWARRQGQAVILSDGDVAFQPHKIERSGLLKAVHGHVLVYVHKQEELRDVRRRYKADHYVLIDDKLRILTAVKKTWGKRVTTVFVRQGHYALDPKIVKSCPPADMTIERIGDLLKLKREDFEKAA